MHIYKTGILKYQHEIYSCYIFDVFIYASFSGFPLQSRNMGTTLAISSCKCVGVVNRKMDGWIAGSKDE